MKTPLSDYIRRFQPQVAANHPAIMLEIGKAERYAQDCHWMEAEECWLLVASRLQQAEQKELHLLALSEYEACMDTRKRAEAPPVLLGPGGDFTRVKTLGGKKAPGRKANP